jgi:protein TonB
MFENYEAAKKRKPPKWAMPLIVTGLVVHVALLMAMWIKSIWEVEKLELPKGRISLGGFAPPPPPPPLKGGKKPDPAKKDLPKKKKVDETVQPTKEPEKIADSSSVNTDSEGPEGGDPDGDENGSLDGIAGGIATAAPPPPPPPPAAPTMVAPTALAALRTAGEAQIHPDDVTKTEIQRSGKAKVVASFKLCVTAGGGVQSLTQLKSSGFPAYDAKIKREMAGWKYRPFMINGRPSQVCTAVTFIYSQK